MPKIKEIFIIIIKIKKKAPYDPSPGTMPEL